MDTPKQANSVCIRCGKTRIFLKSWKDKGESQKGAVIFHELTVCPDKECQKIVDEKFQKMRDLRAASEDRKKSINLAKSQKTAAVK